MIPEASVGQDQEEGSSTVLFAQLAALLVVVAALLAVLGSVLAAQQKAQGVADMAALAGADRSSVAVYAVDGDVHGPCVAAGEVAEANGFSLSSCQVQGTDTFVEVSRRLGVFPGGLGGLTVQAKARAGPPIGFSGSE